MDAKHKENVTPEDFGISGDDAQKARYYADFLVAKERERLLAGYMEIAVASDLQMRDGDFARDIAGRMLMA
jgi:hypothetical protein